MLSTASFKKWAPSLYAYYQNTMQKLAVHPKYHTLRKPSKQSVFSSMSQNYGHSVITVPHQDLRNLAFGWCTVVALGEFDATKGEHLVLHEPQLVVEFPAGSAALIPPAVITHSNVVIGPEDKRASVTFYSLGSLFRFVENDFHTLASLKYKDPAKYQIQQEEMTGKDGAGTPIVGGGRWQKGLALYNTLQPEV
jgi:hypothetical protein